MRRELRTPQWSLVGEEINLCLVGPEFGSVPLVLHSSGHLLLSLVSPSNTQDQYTVKIDYQNSSSGFVNGVQKRDEQTVEALQPRETRSLTNELSQMRRELQILQWSVARAIILMSLLCL